MSLLKNAVDSIGIGLEDYSSTDERRIASCARNLFAGILLLFKYKLSQLSPLGSEEALIKQRVLPVIDESGNILWKGQGKKTVDVQGIQERFKSLNIELDWKRIEKVNKFRNDVEHYYSNQNHESISSLISDTFIIINDFIRKQLNADPKEMLGEQSWAILIEVNEVYEKEKSECVNALDKLDYFCSEILEAIESYTCEDCGSGLIKPTKTQGDASESDFICKSCDGILSYEEIAGLAVLDFYEDESYIACTDGGDTPTVDCPECVNGVYIYAKGICSSCGHTAEHECQRCGSTIMPEEIYSEPYCGWCAHMMAKDD